MSLPCRRAHVAALALALALGACRPIDHKYWSLPVTAVVYEAAWRYDWPQTNALLRSLAFLVCDLPIWPVTILHDVYAFFALEDEGVLPDDVPQPGRGAPLPPPPPAVVLQPVDDGRPVQDPAWTRGALQVERVD